MAKTSTGEPRNPQATSRSGTMPSSGLDEGAVSEIAEQLNTMLADVFAVYLKTKNFHWHMSGPHFRDYHELLDEQSDQLFAITDRIAERVRKIGAPTLRSIGDIARRQRTADSDAEQADPLDMIVELCHDNRALVAAMREAREVCERHQDTASSSLIDEWIDQAERRAWFLFEISRQGDATRH